jgi:spermidine synthase
MLGGGAYSYPKDFLAQFPKATMDVVEIDPGITELARNFFNLKDDARLSIYHEDARTFFLKDRSKYDVIYGDAFHSNSIPYQLTTVEFARTLSNSLTDTGVVLLNIISSIEGDTGQFFRAEYATYASVFPQVFVIPVNNQDKNAVQNLMLVAMKSKVSPSFTSKNPELNTYLRKIWTQGITPDMPILTDEKAPVERYFMPALLIS